ncbi:MAG: HypC/HybG/HupF family hydrogenase formation chaperone [Verrucomicrobiae bacterium]|nr:HypC/HybG/HupF family hydrogenase formation chaperone [Verrucomicrobiae bacterium]MCX7723575.1 HypC/HybG/HupF family hydrogenase formation chaperone [Verrucomicrobiae bacterium]MDW7980278.1 HypC/HybG/HupF family hydrogenase formation chaperone [Verrucomicrobiales bacterium]
MCLAVPGKIESIEASDPLTRLGKVNFGGVVREVSLALVPDAQVGDYVVVHAGFAINRLDEAEAQKVFEYIAALGTAPGLSPSNTG